MYLVLEKRDCALTTKETRINAKFYHIDREITEETPQKWLRKLCVLCVFVVKFWFYFAFIRSLSRLRLGGGGSIRG
jgi:hypothetical protein